MLLWRDATRRDATRRDATRRAKESVNETHVSYIAFQESNNFPLEAREWTGPKPPRNSWGTATKFMHEPLKDNYLIPELQCIVRVAWHVEKNTSRRRSPNRLPHANPYIETCDLHKPNEE